MTINHIDQLTEWWESAEVPTSATLPKDGDRIIIRYNPEWYEIATADGDAGEDELSADTRVLARAPKPKPAWHDAVAVIANAGGDTCVWVRSAADDGIWIDGEGEESVTTDDLRDVTPLIEAKVTDEMVNAAYAYAPSIFPEKGTVRRVLAAALGIEAE